MRRAAEASFGEEGFGVAVDNIGHRFVATTTIVAAIRSVQRLAPCTTIDPVAAVQRVSPDRRTPRT
jgi:hypothetical protein